MTKPVIREPMRRNSRSNRARILAAARQELGRNPDVTLEEIARAAGVVRRTLFGHFPGRAALLDALAEEASEALRSTVTRAPGAEEAPPRALARFVLSIWPVGDRYRLLLALARPDLGTARVPAAVPSASLEALTLSLLESVNTGTWEDDGTRTAVATLLAAGVSEPAATATVEGVAAEVRAEAADG